MKLSCLLQTMESQKKPGDRICLAGLSNGVNCDIVFITFEGRFILLREVSKAIEI